MDYSVRILQDQICVYACTPELNLGTTSLMNATLNATFFYSENTVKVIVVVVFSK